MTILLSLVITFTTVNSPEPEFGYWVCDVIRETKSVDFVVLPNSIFAESTSYRTDTLILTTLSNKELNKLISKNFTLPNFIPISGFTIIIDSLGNLNAIPNNSKEKYSLITTKSVIRYNFDKSTILNQTVTEIVASYIQNRNHISYPKVNRYLFADHFPLSNLPTTSAVEKEESQTKSKININTATKEELESLPGIGPKTAQKIIDYRNENGPFKSIKSIQNVNGIGPKKYEQIKNLITI